MHACMHACLCSFAHSLNGTLLHRLLVAVASIVGSLPDAMLVPGDQKSLMDSLTDAGFNTFFERAPTQVGTDDGECHLLLGVVKMFVGGLSAN